MFSWGGRRDNAQETIDTLNQLLFLERLRSDELLEKLLFAMASVPPSRQHYDSGQVPYDSPQARSDDPWHWGDVQPVDEAKEDISEQVRMGSMTKEEGKAILESLGFPDAEIDVDFA